MKYLRKFNSLAEMQAAIQADEVSFIGMAKPEGQEPTMSIHVHVPVLPSNLTITCSNNTVTISATGSTTLEYKLSVGGEYITYTQPFAITETVTVYAKASNSDGSITGSQECEYVLPSQPNDEIWYTSSDGAIVEPNSVDFGNEITVVDNTYNDDKGIIKLSGNATTIGSDTFQFTDLISIEIPNSVTSIGQNAFAYCSRLTSVTIGNSVTNIGQFAFNSCIELTSIVIPNSVTTINSDAFYGCSSLTEVTIGNSVTTIADNAFQKCSALAEVTIPNSVISIGGMAFYKSGLTEVTIGNSVTNIGQLAFFSTASSGSGSGSGAGSDDSILQTVYCHPTVPPQIVDNVFGHGDDLKIYVPASSVDAYKSAWDIYVDNIFEIQ